MLRRLKWAIKLVLYEWNFLRCQLETLISVILDYKFWNFENGDFSVSINFTLQSFLMQILHKKLTFKPNFWTLSKLLCKVWTYNYVVKNIILFHVNEQANMPLIWVHSKLQLLQALYQWRIQSGRITFQRLILWKALTKAVRLAHDWLVTTGL